MLRGNSPREASCHVATGPIPSLLDHFPASRVACALLTGFSFVQILSPCVTFREDQQKGWKTLVHAAIVPETDDPSRAARRLMTDDGFNTGVLYRGNRKPYQPMPLAHSAPSCLESEFAI